MLTDHPVRENLEAFLRSGSRPMDATARTNVIRHLLAECPTCQSALNAVGWDGMRLERLLHLPGTEPEAWPSLAIPQERYDYELMFRHVERSLDDFLAPDRPLESTPDELLAALTPFSISEQARIIGSEERFASAQLVKWLIERSHAARYEDPERMLHLAHLAQIAADACTAAAVGSAPRLADLRTRAWGHYGNSLRVSARLQEAEEALVTARRHCETGTGDPPLRARLLEQMASLQIFHRQFAAAIELADKAGQIYRELGEAHLLASSLVAKAIASLYAGEAENAALILNHAIPLIDREEDPHLLLAACHNLVHCYIDLDRPEQALALYFKARDLYKEFKDALILLRAAWQEGQLLRELGHPRAAETALLRARKGFMERGLAYEVAVVSLDLAAVYVKLGAVDELKQTVAETMPIFRALRVGRETLASLIQLQQVADQENQALELIRFLTNRLEHLSNRRPLKQ
jgi:tetratricopeptide (TPR) repeat protein